MTPHPSGDSNLASYIALKFWTFESPILPGIFNPFCWGGGGEGQGVGYFLELHNVYYTLLYYMDYKIPKIFRIWHSMSNNC